jgi:phospholipase C
VVLSALAAAVLATLLLVSALWPGPDRAQADALGIHKIKHVVIIMQENRSFDSYFGTFPGADGIPGLAGNPGKIPCSPDPKTGECVRPFHDTSNRNAGGPHTTGAALEDIDRGQMDGFQEQARDGVKDCRDVDSPRCSLAAADPDVMGYHDAHEIPNYWAYARHFVLQDHMFEPVNSWSLPAHLSLVSGWSASCTTRRDPMSCTTALSGPFGARGSGRRKTEYPWTDLTYLLHRYHVSWRYYVGAGGQPDCSDDAMYCRSIHQSARRPGIWNPLPRFDTVRKDHQIGDVTPVRRFYRAARQGRLPSVSWIVPAQVESEHPPARVSTGQAFVTSLINAAMQGPDWKSTAIFLAWDDWGGFYDHVQPPTANDQGYGLRVPGLVISAYARRGYIDHQILSFDAYLKFIEDDFLHGQRIDPATDRRPDSRPGVAEEATTLGNLAADFNFSQKPRRPLILPPHPSRPRLS